MEGIRERKEGLTTASTSGASVIGASFGVVGTVLTLSAIGYGLNWFIKKRGKKLSKKGKGVAAKALSAAATAAPPGIGRQLAQRGQEYLSSSEEESVPQRGRYRRPIQEESEEEEDIGTWKGRTGGAPGQWRRSIQEEQELSRPRYGRNIAEEEEEQPLQEEQIQRARIRRAPRISKIKSLFKTGI